MEQEGVSHANGHAKDTEKQRREPSTARKSLAQFTQTWFTLPMNTAILAVLLHQIPYPFSGSNVLSTIMYVFALVLFIIMALVTLARWTLCFKEARTQTASSVDELALLGAPPIAFLVLSTLTSLIVSEAHWGGHAFTIVAVVMWWIGTAWMTSTCVGVVVALIRIRPFLITEAKSYSPSIMLAAVGLTTNGLTGAVISIYSTDISARLAVPIVIVGFLLVGWGLILSIYLYAFCLQKLFSEGWPPGPKRPSLFFLVGPLGQAPAALIMLSSSAASEKMNFAGYNKGTFLTAQAAPSVSAASILIALLLLGHDIFWILLGVIGLLEGAFKRELTYSLIWWSTIFPLATTAICMLGLGTAMDSPAWNVLTTALIIILYANYFVNWGFTIWHSVFGDLLVKQSNKAGGSKDD